MTEVFGKYRLLEKLGEGGMGVVWRAHQEDLKRDVAIKFFAGEIDEAALARFRREGHAVARLRHPNIVTVHEAGELEGRLYFTMDLVEGGSLRELPMPSARRAMEVAREVALALEHAHAHGVIHRDLKPANVLIANDGRAVVTDFGLSKIAGDDVTRVTRTGEVMGTPAYMSPEQAEGAAVDARADVYGLGALMYQLLTGAAPFPGENAWQVIADVRSNDPPSPRSLNANVHVDAETICRKAMEKEPGRRYGSAAEMRADIERFLAGEPISARPSGAWERFVRRVRRQPVAWSLAGLVVLAALGGAAFGIAQTAASAAADQRAAEHLAEALEQERDGTRAEQEAIVEQTALRGRLELAETLDRAARRLADLETRLARRLDEAQRTAANAELEALLAEMTSEDVASWRLRGEALRLLQRPVEAKEAYTRALEAGPFAAASLGRALVRLESMYESLLVYHGTSAPPPVESGARRRIEEIRADLSAAREGGTLAPSALRLAGAWEVLLQERFDEALAVAMEEIRRGGRNEDFYYLCAAVRNQVGDNAGGAEAAAAAVDRNAGPAHYWFELANDLRDVGRLPEALDAYEEALRRRPRCVPYRVNGSDVLFDLGRVDEALVVISEAIDQEPEDPFLLQNRASILKDSGRLIEAVADFTRAIELDGTYLAPRVDRGVTYAMMGRFDLALADFDEALRMDPDHPHARVSRAIVYAQTGRSGEALAELNGVLERDPENSGAWYNRGQVLMGLDRPDEGISSIAEAVRLEPGNFDQRWWLAHNLLESRRFEEAREQLDILIEQAPRRYDLFYYRGSARSHLQDQPGVIEDMREALRLAPLDWEHRASVEEYLRQVEGGAPEF